ncbi:hypothetical protein IWW55_006530 [Coemansia sp. RSA 2706]|nr:hypothetical protein IWW55_006530 [Coemansia sp. RSA 2706]
MSEQQGQAAAAPKPTRVPYKFVLLALIQSFVLKRRRISSGKVKVSVWAVALWTKFRVPRQLHD